MQSCSLPSRRTGGAWPSSANGSGSSREAVEPSQSGPFSIDPPLFDFGSAEAGATARSWHLREQTLAASDQARANQKRALANSYPLRLLPSGITTR